MCFNALRTKNVHVLSLLLYFSVDLDDLLKLPGDPSQDYKPDLSPGTLHVHVFE